MIKINYAACCSALKYLQGINIYQQSRKDVNLFVFPEDIIMTRVFVSEHSTDAWIYYIKQQLHF